MTILCIEDNDDIQTLLKIVLRSAGYDVAGALSAAEGVSWLDSHPTPEAIMLDVQMPDVDGWQVLESIRARRDTAEVPVIMCTVKARPVDQAHGWELGCDAYIRKPFGIDTIVATVREVLDRSASERETIRIEALHEIEMTR